MGSELTSKCRIHVIFFRASFSILPAEKTPPCGVSALCVSDGRVRALVADAPGNYAAEGDRGEK